MGSEADRLIQSVRGRSSNSKNTLTGKVERGIDTMPPLPWRRFSGPAPLRPAESSCGGLRAAGIGVQQCAPEGIFWDLRLAPFAVLDHAMKEGARLAQRITDSDPFPT
jgi:hypothetical protein